LYSVVIFTQEISRNIPVIPRPLHSTVSSIPPEKLYGRKNSKVIASGCDCTYI
jgi:hypothetical protein